MLFAIKPTGQGLREINHFFFKISLVLTICAQIGWLLDNGTSAPAIFLIFFTAIRYFLRNWTQPLWLCLSWWSLIYVDVPCFWYALAGKTLNQSMGLADIMPPLTGGGLFLPLLNLALYYLVFAALVFSKKQETRKPDERFVLSDQAFYQLLSVCLVLLGISFFRELKFSAQKLDQSPEIFDQVVRVCFHDVAVFFVLCLLNLGRLNTKNRRNVFLVHSLLLILYLAIRIWAGSKGATLTAINIFYIYPAVCAPILGFRQIILPRLKLLVCLVSASPVCFGLGYYFRILGSQKRGALGDPSLAQDIAMDNLGEYQQLIEAILYRISAEFNMYLLLSNDFFQNGINPMQLDLAGYISKNSANLFLPGTPFPECFFMSSMLLSQLLSHSPLESGDYYDLALQLNSQPYTVFGLLTFFFGLAAPLVFFVYCAMIMWCLRHASTLVAIGGLILFVFSLSMYGLECVVHQVLIFVLNIFILLQFSSLLESRKKRASAVPVQREI